MCVSLSKQSENKKNEKVVIYSALFSGVVTKENNSKEALTNQAFSSSAFIMMENNGHLFQYLFSPLSFMKQKIGWLVVLGLTAL